MTLVEDTILENRYRIDKLLTSSETKATYRGFDINMSMPVIVKECFLQTTQAINQFKQEALILTGLRHRALPWVIHHFSFRDRQYLVMDFVEGKNLWELIRERGNPLPERQALETIIQICQGASHLHRQNPPIIHNDITPQNVILSHNGQAVLVGFGIAKQGNSATDTQQPQTQPSISGFVAPERNSGLKATPLSDIYALGATTYAMVTGIDPPHSLSDTKLKPPQLINPKLSDLTAKVIAQAMQPKLADRPQDVVTWQKELEYILKSITTTGPITLSSWSAIASPQDTINLSALQTSMTGTKFWLVDPTGLGYAIDPEPLTIGRSSEADIVIDDSSVSLSHAYVRTDGQNCLVMDIDSTNGTFLNNHRLGSGWYPFNSGDILVIGPTRFHLTNIQPVRLTSTKSKTKATPTIEEWEQATVRPSPPPQAKLTTRQPKKVKNRLWLLPIALLLLIGLGSVAYLMFNPSASSSPTGPPNAAGIAAVATPTSSPTVTPTIPEEPIAQLQSGPTEPLATETPAVPENTLAPTEVLTDTITVSKAVTVTPTNTIAVVIPSETVAVTPGSVQAPTATPTTTGPTAIPLESERTIEQIGSRDVIDVDINPKNANEVYVLVKGDGIYRSDNGGDGPWAKMSLDATGVSAFVIDPTNPVRFYAPTWNAVLKSSDGGNTWEANSSGLLGNQTVNVVSVDPVDPNILYAGVGENLVVSTDGGQSWTSSGYGQGLGVGRLHSIVVDSFNHSIVYVAGMAGSLYKSTDAGNTFAQLPGNVGQGAFSLIAHPTEKDVYLAGINSAGAAILKTENGLDFRSVSDGLVYGGADSPYNALAYAPSNPNIVYAGTGYEDNRLAKGIFKSTNGGETWAQISNDLGRNRDTGQPYYVKSIAVSPADPNVVFAATGGGLYRSVDGGTSWELR